MSRLGQINQTFKSIRIEIKAFLHRQKWKEALIFFFFVLLALGFWLLQSLQQEYEIDINIPVKYKNVPPDISFTETPPEAITVKVKDKGSVLLNYSFGRSFAPIEANMKDQPEKTGKLVINRKSIESDIKKQSLPLHWSVSNLNRSRWLTANVSKRIYRSYSTERSGQTRASKYPAILPLRLITSASMPVTSCWIL